MHSSVAAGIVEVATREEVDLVVLGTRGLGGFAHLLLGSVAEQVVRHAPCSVLTVGREAAEGALRHHGVVVATDLSPAASPALTLAADLARACSTRLTLLHVYDPKLPYPEPGSVQEAFGSPDEVRAALEARATKALQRELGDLSAEAVVLPHARADEAICDFLEERRAELVVVATHGRSGLSRVRLGSVAERLVRSAPCPVLTVRRG